MSAHPSSSSEPAARAGGLLLPMGGGYGELMGGLAAALFECSHKRQVRLVLLPASFSSHACQISADERRRNLEAAECRRLAMEQALQQEAPAGASCSVVLAPICTREDAQETHNLAYFGPDVDAVFLLGGDQAIAMQVLAGTPVEAALCELHRRGGVIAGTSAGAGMQSRVMLAGYADGIDAPHPFEYGVASLWDGSAERGLVFGQAGVVIDQHFFQRGRLPRLLETIVRPGAPRIGVGIDAYTGLHMHGRSRSPRQRNSGDWLGDVFGLHAVAVLDAESLGAADSVRYCGPQRTISVRDVLVHLLAPGPFFYDQDAHRHSLAPRPIARRLRSVEGDRLLAPAGAGLLLLSGSSQAAASEVLAPAAVAGEAPASQFLRSAAAAAGVMIVVAALDADSECAARRCAQHLARRLQQEREAGSALVEAVEFVCGGDALRARLRQAQPYAGIVVVGGKEGEALSAGLEAAAAAWRNGAALWLAGAAAGMAGSRRSGALLPVHENEPLQMAQRRAPAPGVTTIYPGLGLLPATIEPRVLEDCRWGRLFALACECADQPALALGAGVTLVVDGAGAEVVGQGSVFALDLRSAERSIGDNGAYVFANGLLDAYAPGDRVSR